VVEAGGGVGALVLAAVGGDQQAWQGLVERYSGLVWSIARAYGLNGADAADVSQTAWLRLVEHLEGIRDPEAVGAWLATTVRHECVRVLRRAGRVVPTGTDPELPSEDELPDVEERLVADQHRDVLWRAFARLPARCRALLRVLMADPPPAYAEAAAALGMPIGSLGPTRARCLARLRASPELVGIRLDPGGSSLLGGEP
jgi:RNA polymerase sigma factor (sigma-70 family)